MAVQRLRRGSRGLRGERDAESQPGPATPHPAFQRWPRQRGPGLQRSPAGRKPARVAPPCANDLEGGLPTCVSIPSGMTKDRLRGPVPRKMGKGIFLWGEEESCVLSVVLPCQKRSYSCGIWVCQEPKAVKLKTGILSAEKDQLEKAEDRQ